MPVKAFSIEDGNTNIKSLIGARKASYTDIDLAFANKPAGDVFKKTICSSRCLTKTKTLDTHSV